MSKDKIKLIEGDITEMEVDAIVNAANTDLKLGAGVAGAIRRKGGPSIQKQCDEVAPIPLGEAVITTAGELKAEYVIHAAGMKLGGKVTEESLRNCTRNSLLRAEEKGLKSLAFPAIGTGVGGFSLERCAEVMLSTVLHYLKKGTSLETVYFCLFGSEAFQKFLEVYDRL